MNINIPARDIFIDWVNFVIGLDYLIMGIPYGDYLFEYPVLCTLFWFPYDHGALKFKSTKETRFSIVKVIGVRKLRNHFELLCTTAISEVPTTVEAENIIIGCFSNERRKWEDSKISGNEEQHDSLPRPAFIPKNPEGIIIFSEIDVKKIGDLIPAE